MTPSTRHLTIDLLRVIATLGVVAIHADVITASTTNYVGGLSWWMVNVIHSAARVSVPFFIMISGYIHLNRVYSPSTIARKALFRLVIPLCVWTIVYIAWDFLWLHRPQNPRAYLQSLLTGTPFHFYFLFVLIGLYLLTPLFSTMVHRLSLKLLTVVIGLIFVLAALATLISYLGWRTGLPTLFCTIWLPYTGYYLTGHLLSRTYPPSRRLSFIFAGFSILLVLFIALFNYFNIHWFNQGLRGLWTFGGGNYVLDAFNPMIICLSLLVFYLILHVPTRLPSRFLVLPASAGYGIYLIHPLVLQIIDHYFHLSIQFVTGPLWLYYLEKVILVYGFSFIIVTLFRGEPFHQFLKLIRYPVTHVPHP